MNAGNDKGILWHSLKAVSISDLVDQLKVDGCADYHRLNAKGSVPFYDDNIYYTENFSHTKWNMKLWGSEKIGEKIPAGQMRESRFVMIVDKYSKNVYIVLGNKKGFRPSA